MPKLPLAVATVTALGITGDEHDEPLIHGGPTRALCLFPLELIEELRAAGHPIEPGGVGENVTTSGLDWSQVAPGARLRLGIDVLIEVTTFTDPCKTRSRATSPMATSIASTSASRRGAAASTRRC